MKKSNKKNNNNPYSFYVLDKNEVFSSLVDYIDVENEEDINTLDSCNIDSAPYININVFSHQDNKILQQYCFSDGGSTGLYREFGDNKLAVLYEEEKIKDGSSNIYIYTPNTMYVSIQKNNNFIKIFSMKSEDYKFDKKVFSKPVQIPVIKRIAQPLSTKYCLNHINGIVVDSKYVDSEGNKVLYNEFKNNYMRYNVASKLIPAQCTIRSILDIINHYIATGKVDKNRLLTEYLHLQNFQKLCSGTIQDISPFIYNPSTADLRNISDSLNYKINNIENLINMYLSNELER